MGQDGATHNGQVGVGAHKVVGELAHKVQQLAKAGPVDLHGGVLPVQADAVLVVVHIGGVLQKPGGAVDGDGDNAVVLPGGVIDPAGVALVLGAQLAPGIGGGGQVPGGGNSLGVLLRLGEVDGNVQLAVLGGRLPLHILGDPVPADVIGVLAELIIPVGGLLGVLRPQGLEFVNHLAGTGGESAHDLGVKKVPVDNGVLLQNTPGMGIVHEGVQNDGQFSILHRGQLLGHGTAVQLQHLQQGVYRPKLLLGPDELLVQGVGNQLGNGLVTLHAQTSSYPWGWFLCQAQAEATMVPRSLY